MSWNSGSQLTIVSAGVNAMAELIARSFATRFA